MKEKITVYNPGDGQGRPFRLKIFKRWSKSGGVLLISDALFRTSMKTTEMGELLSNPHAIFLDERLVSDAAWDSKSLCHLISHTNCFRDQVIQC
jgi:hypothetical protein